MHKYLWQGPEHLRPPHFVSQYIILHSWHSLTLLIFLHWLHLSKSFRELDIFDGASELLLTNFFKGVRSHSEYKVLRSN